VFLLKLTSFFPENLFFPERIFLARFLPWDPLYPNHEETKSIFLLTTSKDLDVLQFSLASVMKNIAREGSAVTIVAPDTCGPLIRNLIRELSFPYPIRLKSDESILEEFGLDRSRFPTGHSLMQIIKFLCVLSSEDSHSIVLDGDTIFLRRRVWATRNRIVLVVPPEYQSSHVHFVERNFQQISHSKLGFTTQAQVMKKDWVQEMVEAVGGLESLVSTFTEAMTKFLTREDLQTFPCEWQFLGDWLLTHKKDSIELSSYLNISRSRVSILPPAGDSKSLEYLDAWVSELTKQFSGEASISLHAYLPEK
jgi:hypothetical protein